MRVLIGCLFVLAAVWQSSCLGDQTNDLEFFENKIRPILVDHCYQCHNSSDTAEGDLSVDWRDGIRKESASGTAVVPGKPNDSLLLKVIRHEISGLEMPDDDAKLSEEVIADFEKWIADGAVDPRDNPPTAAELAEATSWEATLAKRKKWWSFQPIVNPPVPPVPNHFPGLSHPIDRFVADKLKKNGLQFSNPADKKILIRRLYFAIVGLPPPYSEVKSFVNNNDPRAFAQLVDRLLESKHYGERWARHWMDLVRYADSHGSEGDPLIPNIYQYRDYLIRAFNADVPYHQLVREHIAGDLLINPRVNKQLGINESTIGTAHFRLCFHGFAPTDALDEKVRFTDDQINVLSKTFLGLTVSCARCHDHKFDAISQSDYYALFGILGSVRPAMQDVNLPSRQQQHRLQLADLKSKLKLEIAKQWMSDLEDLEERIVGAESDESTQAATAKKPDTVTGPISLYKNLDQQIKDGKTFNEVWNFHWDQFEKQALQESSRATSKDQFKGYWHFSDRTDYAKWFAAGNGIRGVSAAGEFAINLEEDTVVDAIFPGGVYTNRLSDLHRGVLSSPRIELDGKYKVYLRLLGGGQSTVRYVVQNYPRDGTVYPIQNINGDQWYWHQYDLSYWTGDQAHLEIATGKDAPLVVRGDDRSWFGVREVVIQPANLPPPVNSDLEFAGSILKDRTVKELAELPSLIQSQIRSAVTAWSENATTDQQALLLNAALREGLLTNRVTEFAENNQTQSMLAEYRRLESKIPVPTRVPGVSEAIASDSPLFDRGNHRKPLAPVPRRFLEAIDPTPYVTRQSGRLELAEDILRSDNPLTARVIANRLWHYLFGRGIVETPDNFGQLGAKPTHPQLLDYLATKMVEENWSMKQMIRFIVTSQTWQQESLPSSAAQETDPENKWLSHANIRRLEAEAIRDSLLTVAGQLDTTMYGPGFGANSRTTRRSVYIASRRNSLDEFLNVFDSPVPFATTGRRNQTNVPAQSLTMLNDPFVIEIANRWANHSESDKLDSIRSRVESMFAEATGRLPGDKELDTIVEYHSAVLTQIKTEIAARKQLGNAASELAEEINNLIVPAREKLLAAKRNENSVVNTGPDPIARWDFQTGLEDSVGNLHATLHGSARLEEDGLLLDGNGFAATPPIGQEIRSKTLEVWLRLSDLNQRGGGAITIQDLQGNVFDSIVIGERRLKRWIAGSNGFARTQDVAGADESDKRVHIAVAYDPDGTIRLYRNGESYGKSYRKNALAEFSGENSQIAFGIRHGTVVTKARMLKGKIFEARLYDRALSAEEVNASSSGLPFVSGRDVLDSLSDVGRQEVAQLRSELEQQRAELRRLGPEIDEEEVWTRIAHAIFNMKEFIYVR